MIGVLFTNIFALFSSFSLSATAGLLSERSGTVNIALDGKMIVGGLIWALLMTGSMGEMQGGAFIALLLAGVGSMIFALILAIPTVNLYADHVIAGTAVNMLAAAIALLTIFAVTGTSAITLPGSGELSGGWAGSIDTTSIIYLFIAVGTMALVWVGLNLTPWGLRLKSAGENPYSLASAGVSVARTRYVALLMAGFLSGMAGAMAMLTMGSTFTGTVNGMGYISLAILIFSRWNIMGIAFGTLLISVAMGFARSWSNFDTQIPSEVISMIPFLLPLISLVLMKKFYTDKGKGLYGGAPKMAGIPFKKDQR